MILQVSITIVIIVMKVIIVIRAIKANIVIRVIIRTIVIIVVIVLRIVIYAGLELQGFARLFFRAEGCWGFGAWGAQGLDGFSVLGFETLKPKP